MLDNGPVIAAFGAYLGILISAHFAPGFTQRKLASDPLKLKIARLFMLLAMNVPQVFLYRMLNFKLISNVYLLMVIKCLLPTFLASFICFGYADRICDFAGLYNFEEPRGDKENLQVNKDSITEDEDDKLSCDE